MIDVLDELKREQRELEMRDNVLRAVNATLSAEFEKEKAILHKLGSQNVSRQESPRDDFKFGAILDEKTIERTCVNFRMRCLPAPLFSGNLPLEAIQKIKQLNLANTDIEFHIIAPAERFKLKDSTKDPVLLANVGNGKYMVIHQWGSDLNAWERIVNFPFRNIQSLGITAACLAVIIALLVPIESAELLAAKSTAHAVFLKVFAAFILCGFFFISGIIFGLLKNTEFSQDAWKSSYFN